MLIFVCPAVMDSMVFLVLFAVSYGAGERGLTLTQGAWLGGLFQLTYLATSFVLGFQLSRRNAKALLVAGVAGSVVTAAVALVAQSFWPILIALAGFGIAAAFFFNAFQTFMRAEAPPGGLATATGWYTLAWSGGSSVGFLISGTLYRFGPLTLTLITVGVGTVMLAVLARHRSRPHDIASAEEQGDHGDPDGAPQRAAYVWVAWVLIFTAMFVQRPIQTFYPMLSAKQGVAPALAGLPLFLHMLVQGVCGAVMIWAPRLCYRRLPHLAIQAGAAALLLALAAVKSYALAATGIAVLGAWAGFSYFVGVYYASNSGHRSRNIGINECLVGVGSFASLFVSNWFMKWTGNDRVMYVVCGVTLLGSAVVQWALAGKDRAGRSPVQAPR